MSLVALLFIPMIGAGVAWWSERRGPQWPRWIALLALAFELAAIVPLWVQTPAADEAAGGWLVQWTMPWIPSWGIAFHLAMDGLSLALVFLTAWLGVMAVVASWSGIRERVGLFHCNLLLTLVGVVGVFLAMDLFLFFVFWEVMLIPMYVLIIHWGHEHRIYAGYKFFLFTQAGSLLLLLAIVALAAAQASRTGNWSFDYHVLLANPPGGQVETWLMLGFLAAFVVKLPMFPFHTWLPDAHTEAPTAGSVLLAGLLLKTGAYGLIRFAVPLFPEASRGLAPVLMFLGVVGILYGAMLALAQTDLKRLVAYSSISHMGFVLLGVYAGTRPGLDGAIIQMLAHGISTGALFMLVGALEERLHTRELHRMGGLWARMPRLGALLLFFAVATLGLPGLGNFVGEFLVLIGSYPAQPAMTIAATAGIVLAAVYALTMIQRTLHGAVPPPPSPPDLRAPLVTSLAIMAAGLLWLGVYPQPVLHLVAPAGHQDGGPVAAPRDGGPHEHG